MGVEGPARSAMAWAGYATNDVRVQPQAPRRSSAASLATPADVPRSSSSQRILVPSGVGDHDDPVWQRELAARRRVRRLILGFGAVLTIGIVAATAFFVRALVQPATPIPAGVEAAAPIEPTELARARDDLVRAATAYMERSLLFDERMMTCGDLQAGLVLVEGKLVAFSALRREQGAMPGSASSPADQAAFDAADRVEQHFERSRCSRP
jgi:hypothetical protein